MSYATLAQLGCESNENNIVENYNSRDCDRARIECMESCRDDMRGQPICTKACMQRKDCKTNINEGFKDETESCTDIKEKCRLECWADNEIGQWPCQQKCMKDSNCPM